MSSTSLSFRLGEHLLSQAKLTKTELSNAQALPEASHTPLGNLLSITGLVSDTDIAAAYSTILTLPLYVNDQDAINAFPPELLKESYLRTSGILPIKQSEHEIIAVTSKPEDPFAIEALKLATGKKVRLLIGTQLQIEQGLDQLFGNDQTQMDGIVERLDTNVGENDQATLDKLLDQALEAPVVKLVNLIIQGAVEARASDIHIEAFENQLKIRYRIDGILQQTESPPAHSTAAIISRTKLMAKMNVAERRLPQDGALQIRLQGKLIDLRVSTIPTLHGESLVLRILDQNNVSLELDDLGFSDNNRAHLSKILKSPHGIVLVTGPTGSGKTTTLYAALKTLNTNERKIMTVEDPVEYQLSGINQVQAKPDIGLTFANALRSIVRQDPDIIMIGEIRDLETARTAVQSALTGHLVFSTLHTNDAGSSVTRLLDMGIESFLVNSTVKAIVAQRLVRKLCPHCRKPFTAPDKLIKSLNLNPVEINSNIELFEAGACDHCDQSGYRGRVVIAEILELTDTLKQAILNGEDGTKLQALAEAKGMISMRSDGIQKALAGITTIEEVSRVTFI